MTTSRPDRSGQHMARIRRTLARQALMREPNRPSKGARRRFPVLPLLAACCLLAVALVAGMASAQVTSVTVDSSKPFEKVDGYTYVEATMHGTVEREDGSVGEYSVPMILIYPDDGGNGVGVVDWPNWAYYVMTGFEDLDEWMTIEYTRRNTEGYLFENGYTYASVQWSKNVVELFADVPPGEDSNHLVRGTIERGTDAFPILRDAARFLKDPSTFEDANGPLPVEAVLSSGFSLTAGLQNQFLLVGENLDDDVPVYDGHLLAMTNLGCEAPRDEGPIYGGNVPCPEVPVGRGDTPILVIQGQTDVELGGAAAARGEDDPHWRQYQLAGVSHLPAPIFPGLSEVQDPVDPRPVFRAAFRNLTRWVTEGTPAPPSMFIEGTVGDDGRFTPSVDGDGNALGGLRLPHMEQELDGEMAGAPLGTYAGVNPADPEDLLALLSGTFTPFSDEELAGRYPDHETYVSRVARAADYLLERGYILEVDRDAYVAEAEQSSISR